MRTEARAIEDAHQPNPSLSPNPIARIARTTAATIGLTLAAPFSILAPRWFARHVERHPLTVSLTITLCLAADWSDAMSRTEGIRHNILILGALGFVGLCAVATVLSITLVSRWDEPTPAGARRACRLVFCFGGGFCLSLLLIYYFALPAAQQYIDRIPWGTPLRKTLEVATTGTWLAGLLISAIAPIRIFRGLASAGGGEVPPLEPLCRDCGYDLQGIEGMYRAGAIGFDARDLAEPVCSECGCPLRLSMERTARPGTTWTTGQDLSMKNWRRTLRQVMHRPGQFFEQLPLDSSRTAAELFWRRNLAAALATIAALFAANHAICHWTGIAFPVPIMGYQSAPTVATPTLLWLPATFAGMGMVMWAVVMTSLLVGCGTGAYVFNRASLLRERNVFPAGWLLGAYLSGHVLAILVLATAAFLGVRLAVLAIPTDPPAIRFEWLMLLRNYAGYIGTAAGVLVAGAGGLLWYWPTDTRAGAALRHANY